MLLIGNGRVITRDDALPYLADGAVALDGERVGEVGPLDAMKAKYPDAEFVDARGGVIMPGLINAHTHIYSGLARGLGIEGNDPTNFLEVLEGTWWPDIYISWLGNSPAATSTGNVLVSLTPNSSFRSAHSPIRRRNMGTASVH